MKQYSTLLIAFLFSFISTSYGQGLKSEIGLNDSYLQHIQQVANKGAHSYALVEYDFHSVFLEKYDSLGTRIEKVNVAPDFGFSSLKSNRMVITNDGNIWITAMGFLACDIPMVYQHVVVFDSDCQFINNYTKALGPVNNTLNYRALTAVSDTSVAVNYKNTDSSWIEILSPTTQSILDNVNVPDLFGFGKNSQFHVLGHTITKIYGIDNQGAIVDSIVLPTFIREIGTWNDTIIALSANSLLKITPDLQSFTTHPIPNLSAFTRLKIDNQGVRFISSNFNKGIHYLDHALNIQSLTTVPVFDPNNTIFDFDEFLTVAKDFQLSSYTSVRLANYSLSSTQSTTVNRSDIAVLDIQLSDAYAEIISAGNVYKTDAKANVLIKNNGPNIVDSVRLNHFVSNATFCGDIVNSAYFDNLNLAVGDSVWVDFGWLGENTQSYSGDSLNREYCVYSSNPNGIVDLNIANDNGCKTQFFGFVGLEDSKELQFQVYPNPFSANVRIEVPDTFEGSFRITDNAGRLVHSGILNSAEIQLSNLHIGVYFVTLVHQNGSVSLPKKLIKQ